MLEAVARFLDSCADDTVRFHAKDIAMSELLALAAHLHLDNGRSDEMFLQAAFASFIAAEHDRHKDQRFPQ